MALAGGGAGRTSVLVFTMPFWTLLLAWPVLGERVRGLQWIALVARARRAHAGRRAVELAGRPGAEAMGRAVGIRLGGRHGRDQILPARRTLRHAQFHRVADAGRRPAAFLAAVSVAAAGHETGASTRSLLLVYSARSRRRSDFCCGSAMLRFLPAGTASLNMLAIPVIALLSSMAVFGERLDGSEWIGIGVHRHRPRDHLVRRVAGESSRRAVHCPSPRPLRRRAKWTTPDASGLAKLKIDRELAPMRARARTTLAVARPDRGDRDSARRVVHAEAASGRRCKRRPW